MPLKCGFNSLARGSEAITRTHWWNAWLPSLNISMLTLLAAQFTKTLQRFQQYDPGWRQFYYFHQLIQGWCQWSELGDWPWHETPWHQTYCCVRVAPVVKTFTAKYSTVVALGSHWAAPEWKHRWMKQIFIDHSSREYFSSQGHSLQVSQTSVGCWLRKQLELGPTPLMQLHQYPAPGPKLDIGDKERDPMLSWILKHQCFSTSAFCSRKHWVKFFMPHTAHDYDDEQKVFEVLGPELSSTSCAVCPCS